MLLSILIPTYNFDCTKLVEDLLQQLPGNSEIIVGDDGSTDQGIKQRLSHISQMPTCRLYASSRNIGRSAIRNRLARQSQGEWLLYLDSDAEVIHEDFLQNYLQEIQHNPGIKVLCGGIKHPDKLPCKEVSLRYNYEKKAEPRFTAANRRKNEYSNFRTFNFMIRRDIMCEHPFDENIVKYGYEDVILGAWLQRDNIHIHHIDNEMMNGDIETNPRFVEKTEEAMQTLATIPDIIRSHSALVVHYNRLQHFHLTGLIRIFHRLFGRTIRRNLCSDSPRLALFNFYKLSYYACLKKE